MGDLETDSSLFSCLDVLTYIFCIIKKINNAGTNSTIIKGKTVMIDTIVPTKLAKVLSQDLMLLGRVASHTSTSFENLFTILPRGVVSKKGHRTLHNSNQHFFVHLL